MISKPIVSVIVPAYNVRSYIESSLASLESQSLPNFEALIVDDGSTDDTSSLVKNFVQRDSRFKLLTKPNGGLSSARNYGIRHAQSDYIALLDADDIYHEDKLKTHVTVLEKECNVGVVYSASKAINDDGHPTPVIISGKPVYKDTLFSLLCKNFVGHGSNAVFRRTIFEEIGGFDETLRSCEDLDYWLRIAETKKWHFSRIPEVLCYYRVRPSGLSFDVSQMQSTQTRVLRSAYERSPETVAPMIPTAEAYMFRYLARLSLVGGNVKKARELINKAWIKDRSIFLHDPRSLLTLLMVKLSPISQYFIKRTLGS